MQKIVKKLSKLAVNMFDFFYKPNRYIEISNYPQEYFSDIPIITKFFIIMSIISKIFCSYTTECYYLFKYDTIDIFTKKQVLKTIIF